MEWHRSIKSKACFTILCNCINSRARTHHPSLGIDLLINSSVGMQCSHSNGEAEHVTPGSLLYVSVIVWLCRVFSACELDASSGAAGRLRAVHKSRVKAVRAVLQHGYSSQWIIESDVGMCHVPHVRKKWHWSMLWNILMAPWGTVT